LISPLRIVAAGIFVVCPVIAATCESLSGLSMPGVTVTSAAVATTLVEFCRVKAVARPVADSEIQIEVWLPPPASWNGKLLGTGNGGYSGAMSVPAMQAALRDGYAVPVPIPAIPAAIFSSARDILKRSPTGHGARFTR